MNTTEPQQGVSTEVLTSMYNATKALQLYPVENEIVGRSLSELQDLVDTVFEREGGLGPNRIQSWDPHRRLDRVSHPADCRHEARYLTA